MIGEHRSRYGSVALSGKRRAVRERLLSVANPREN
jgi:hypothetical protein